MERRRELLRGRPPGAVVVEDVVLAGRADIAAFVVRLGFVRVRVSLDGFGRGRRRVTLSMRASGRLRRVGIASRSRGVRGGSLRVGGAVGWLRAAV